MDFGVYTKSANSLDISTHFYIYKMGIHV